MNVIQTRLIIGVIIILLPGDVNTMVHLVGQPGHGKVHGSVEVVPLIVGEVGEAVLEGGVQDPFQGGEDFHSLELQEGGEVAEPRVLLVGHGDQRWLRSQL